MKEYSSFESSKPNEAKLLPEVRQSYSIHPSAQESAQKTINGLSMSVLIPRTRTIGVRLSEQEYAALEKYCVENGARSISDLARSAICGLVNQVNQEHAPVDVEDGPSMRVKHLQEKLEMLAAEIASLKAGVQPGGGERVTREIDEMDAKNDAPACTDVVEPPEL